MMTINRAMLLAAMVAGTTGCLSSGGGNSANVDADFFWRTAITDAALESQRSNSDPEVIEASQGYVDGFNRYVEEIRRGEHPGRHQACRDSDWLLPLTLDDMFRRYFLGQDGCNVHILAFFQGAWPTTGPGFMASSVR